MAKAAHSDELKAAFDKHHAETEGQVERIEQVFELLDKPARGKTCPAILGLVEEGQEVMKDFKTSDAHDAGLLSGAQAVEHYEISRYGTLIAWAEQLGLRDAARLLKQNLDEEKKTDAALTRLAESSLNQMAA
jgi:ferritin-like metal-binding protein YciE